MFRSNLFLKGLGKVNASLNYYPALPFSRNLMKRIKDNPISVPNNPRLNTILYINTSADKGGAARCAYENLYKTFRDRKQYNTEILVKNIPAEIKNERFRVVPKNSSHKQQFLLGIQEILGWQDFFHLGSFDIKHTTSFHKADIIHLHNLHGGYFSPFALPELSALKPTIWTLHDQHSFTGHCAITLDCEKWKCGCGDCPMLLTYPQVIVDATAFVLKTKKQIYNHSHITFVTPSSWLKHEAEQSILGGVDMRVIPNGIDESVFRNHSKKEARKELLIPKDRFVLMFCATNGTENPFKGGKYIKKIINILRSKQDIHLICVGGQGEDSANVTNVPYLFDDSHLAKYYSAADLFIYPTLADTFPYVILESMACGTPVVSFQAGGVPEQLEHLETGYIAKYKDLEDFLKGILLFMENKRFRMTASQKAREVIEEKFTLDRSIDEYEKLYHEIWEKRKRLLH